MVEQLDITSEGLKNQGYRLTREGATIALYYNGSCHRVGIYKADWNKTTKKVEEKLGEAGIPWEVIQSALFCMSTNYPKVMSGYDYIMSKFSSLVGAETETPPARLDDISYEEWQAELVSKYVTLQQTIRESVMPLPQLILPLEFALSVKNVLNLSDNTLPFAGFLLGAPSSLKTVTVELFRAYWHARYRDDFSPKAFVSHYSGLTEEDLQKVDLLPEIRFKLFLTPELAPLFTGNEDDIKKAFGILTRLLDGKGLQSHSGTQGGRGYYGDYMFTWFGAVVDISQRVHRMMGNLGPKMYFLRLPKSYYKEKDLIEQLQNPRFVQDRTKIEAMLIDYLKWFEASPAMQEKNGLPKMVWDDNRNDAKATKHIARLADLIRSLRGVAEVQDTEDTYGSTYAYSSTVLEEPWRANQQLHNLAKAHALIEGRNYITMSDIPLLIKVVLSTAPIARVAIFELLLAYKGTLRTADIESALDISPHTVHKTMTELNLVELVDMKKEGEFDNSPLTITLNSKFKWCLGTRFKQLREGFTPTRKPRKQVPFSKRGSNQGDNMDPDSAKRAKMSGDVIHDFPSAFWIYFNEEEKIHEHEPTIEGWKLVSESQLKQRLIASGRFTAGEAAQVIIDAIDTGRIRKIALDNLVKNSQANLSKNEEN
jgi:hypothetical protein